MRQEAEREAQLEDSMKSSHTERWDRLVHDIVKKQRNEEKEEEAHHRRKERRVQEDEGHQGKKWR